MIKLQLPRELRGKLPPMRGGAFESLQATGPAQAGAAGTPGTLAVHSLVDTSATAGQFQITYFGETTAPLPWNATAAQVATALQALPSVGAQGVVCAGGALPTAVTITFTGPLANTVQAVGTIATSTLVGGTAAITSSTTGVVAVGLATEVGIVPSMDEATPTVSVARIASPTAVTGANTNTATIKVRSLRAGAVTGVLGGVTFTSGINLVVEQSLAITMLSQPVSATGVPVAAQAGGATSGGPSSGEVLQNLKSGDLIDVLYEQSGTGLALPVGIDIEVEFI